MDQDLTAVTTSIKAGIDAVGVKQDAMQRQLDAVDQRTQSQHSATMSHKSLADHLRENDQFQRLMADKRGVARLTLNGADSLLISKKTVLTETGQGFQVSGVLPIERIPGLVPEPRPVLTVRSVLASRPTTQAIVDFVRVQSPLAIASPVSEGSLKPENSIVFVSSSERIKTLASWLPASKQIMDDWGELSAFLTSSLAYYCDLGEEIQLLSGDGTGENLHGLLPQSSSFNSSLLPSGSYTRLDMIAAAVAQIAAKNELPPTFAIVHPNDWWKLRMTKDAYGRYVLGDPQSDVSPRIFGLDVVVTTSIAAGTFLVGSGSPVASEIVDRMTTQVEISTENQDFFIKNLVAIRGEKRLALIVKRPGSYVSGQLNSSPAS